MPTRLPRASSVLATIEPGQAVTADESTLAPGEIPIAFRVLRTTQTDGYEEPAPPSDEPVVADGTMLAAARGDNFSGTARRAAKISIAEGDTEEFNDLKDLIGSLTSDDDMIALDIPSGRNSNRVDLEQRNVRVRAFIYAASRENDNDFHVILGRDPDQAEELYMNVEVSGLPPASQPDHATLKTARDAYQRFFRRHPGGLPGSRYDFYDPPVPVTVSGSLFFDVTHATGGKPGPEDLRDDIPTIWEIHPITRLEFRRG